jgi:predicted metal-dependent HD superfamily phosphohydrolase
MNRIYKTKEFSDKYEAAAKSNLMAELARLTRGTT